jgi:hypothetical protein
MHYGIVAGRPAITVMALLASLEARNCETACGLAQLNSTQLEKDLGHIQKAASSRKAAETEKVADTVEPRYSDIDFNLFY